MSNITVEQRGLIALAATRYENYEEMVAYIAQEENKLMASACGCSFIYESDEDEPRLSECDKCLSEDTKPDDACWTEHRTIIRSFLDELDSTPLSKDRVSLVKELYAYLRTVPEFMCAHPRFRTVVAFKLDEFVAAGFPAKAARAMRDFLNTLTARADYR